MKMCPYATLQEFYRFFVVTVIVIDHYFFLTEV